MGLARAGGERFLQGEGGLAPRAAGVSMGSAWTRGGGPAFLLPGAAPAGASLTFPPATSQARVRFSNSPRCTTGGLLLHSSLHRARKCLHKPSPRRAEGVWTGLGPPTDDSPGFLISSGSSPAPAPPKAGRFFPDLPSSQLCSQGLPQQRPPGKKSQEARGSAPEALLSARGPRAEAPRAGSPRGSPVYANTSREKAAPDPGPEANPQSGLESCVPKSQTTWGKVKSTS